MAVIAVRDLVKGASGSLNVRGQRKYTRKFQVRTDDIEDGPSVVNATLLLPGVWGAYVRRNDADSGALVEDIQSDCVGFKLFETTVTYSTITPQDGLDENGLTGTPATGLSIPTTAQRQAAASNPTLRGPQVRWDFEPKVRAAHEDLTGAAYQNSARDAFDPAWEEEIYLAVLTVQRFESTFSPALSLEFGNTLNDDTFLGADRGHVLCKPFTASRHTENGVYCWDVGYKLIFNMELNGWRTRILDQGFRSLVAGVPQQNRDDKGQVESAPQLLNGRGLLLRDANTTVRLIDVNLTDNFVLVVSTNLLGPPEDGYVVKIDDELMKVTSHSVPGVVGVHRGVERGHAGTAAAAHAVGATVQQMPFYREFEGRRYKDFSDLGLT
jgi:hypothetical protein